MPDAPSSTSRYLLVSDLDGTLLGDTPALERFAEWYEPRRERLALAYSSGRLHGSMLGSIQNSPLPEPNYVVSGVGTEIRTYGSDVAWADWHGHFADWSAKTVCSIIEEAFNLERQPEEFLSPWKVSYYAHDLSEAEVVRIAAKLESAGLRVRLIYSSARDLDILPAAAGKGGAARFLAQREGFQRERLFGAGDSGNDTTLLQESGRGIIVSNALPELKVLNGPTIYHSPHRFAAGVLDGLQHWLNGEL